MATVVLTFTDVRGMDGNGDIEASIESDTPIVVGDVVTISPAQALAAAAFRTAMRMSDVPPTEITKTGDEPMRPLNNPDHMGEL